jgi:hypothetical protein
MKSPEAPKASEAPEASEASEASEDSEDSDDADDSDASVESEDSEEAPKPKKTFSEAAASLAKQFSSSPASPPAPASSSPDATSTTGLKYWNQKKEGIFASLYVRLNGTEQLRESAKNNSEEFMKLLGQEASKHDFAMWSGGVGRKPFFTNTNLKYLEWIKYLTKICTLLSDRFAFRSLLTFLPPTGYIKGEKRDREE